MDVGHRGSLSRIYLDNCASTPAAPEVVEAVARGMATPGNPSSIHHEGQQAARVVADARKLIADSLGARPTEIVFCASGTEANNLAIGGLVSKAIRERGRAQIVTSIVEHASVQTRIAWEKRVHGDALEVVTIGVDANGQLDAEELTSAISDETTLVALLLVNNETGVLQNIDKLKQAKHAQPAVPWLLDVVQGHGKVALDVRLLPFEILSFSAHKIYGPRGIGALFVRGGVEPDPLIVGGAQEKFRRAGTEDLAGIVGFAEAVKLLPLPEKTNAYLAHLETIFRETLQSQGVDFTVNGPTETAATDDSMARLPGFLNLSFEGATDRGDLQIALDLAGVSLSSTSACHSGVTEESHVLAAMGIDGERRSGAIRLLFSRYHTEADARTSAEIIAQTAQRIRAAGPSAHSVS